MHCHTLPGCSHAKTLSVTVLAACVSQWEKIVLSVGFKPQVTSQYTSHAAGFAYVLYLDDRMLMSMPVHMLTCQRRLIACWSRQRRWVILARWCFACTCDVNFLLLTLRQSHCCHKQSHKLRDTACLQPEWLRAQKKCEDTAVRVGAGGDHRGGRKKKSVCPFNL